MVSESIAVDFGTSYFRLGYLGPDWNPVLVPNPEMSGGNPQFPSLYVSADGGPGVSSLKRLLLNQGTNNRLCLTAHIQLDEDNQLVNRNEEIARISLPQVLEFFFKRWKKLAEDHLGKNVSQILITMPPVLNDSASLEAAATYAGFKQFSILSDDLAAVLGFFKGKPLNSRIGILDFGGGKVSFSIVKTDMESLKRVAYGCDLKLGGEDMNLKILEHILEDDAEEGPSKIAQLLQEQPESMREVLQVIERLKCGLSHRHSVDFVLPQLGYSKTFTSFEVNQSIREMVEQALLLCQKVMQEAGMSVGQLDSVVLVGGASRIPFIRSELEQFFERKDFEKINPDQMVIEGATRALKSTLVFTDDQVLFKRYSL